MEQRSTTAYIWEQSATCDFRRQMDSIHQKYLKLLTAHLDNIDYLLSGASRNETIVSFCLSYFGERDHQSSVISRAINYLFPPLSLAFKLQIFKLWNNFCCFRKVYDYDYYPCCSTLSLVSDRAICKNYETVLLGLHKPGYVAVVCNLSS